MIKTVEIKIDIAIARKMLKVAGFKVSEMTDTEVFDKVLSLIEKYGASIVS